MRFRLNNSAQQIIEYLALFGGILVLVFLFTKSNGMFRPAVNQMLYQPTGVLYEATNEMCVGYQCGARCGNGTCETASGERCSCPAGSPAGCIACPTDCPCGTCGNEICEEDETCKSCSDDCGPCLHGGTCGNGTCDSGEECGMCWSPDFERYDCGPCTTGSTCGNNKLDSPPYGMEQCDPSQPLEEKALWPTCQTLGFDAGTLICPASGVSACTFTGCYNQCGGASGSLPTGSSLCNGAGTGVMPNSSYIVVGNAASACTGAKCEVYCNSPTYIQSGNSCTTCGNGSCEDGQGGRPDYGETCGMCWSAIKSDYDCGSCFNCQGSLNSTWSEPCPDSIDATDNGTPYVYVANLAACGTLTDACRRYCTNSSFLNASGVCTVCGNGICEDGEGGRPDWETCGTCPTDCGCCELLLKANNGECGTIIIPETKNGVKKTVNCNPSYYYECTGTVSATCDANGVWGSEDTRCY